MTVPHARFLPIILRRARLGAALLALFLGLLLSAAQFPGVVTTAVAQTTETAAPPNVKERLDSISAQLQQFEATLKRADLTDQQLQDVRGQVQPLSDELRTIIAEEQRRLEGVNARLAQLGPAPDAKSGATESSDVAQERTQQEKLQKVLDEQLRIARFQNEKATQLSTAIAERRRELFTNTLFARSSPLVSPVLWLDVIRSGPTEISQIVHFFRDWWEQAADRLDLTRAVIVGLFALLLAAGAPRLIRFVYSFENRAMDRVEPSRLSRALMALQVSIGASLVPVLACVAVYMLLEGLDLMPDRVAEVLRAFLIGLSIFFVGRAIAMGVVPITKPQWRVFEVSDAMAMRIRVVVSLVAIIVTTGRTLEALSRAVFSPLTISIVLKGVTAVLVALAIMQLLRGAPDDEVAQAKADEACLGPETPTVERSTWLRLVGWLVVLTIIVAAAAGYVALAAFLAQQTVWISVVAVFATLLAIIIDEAIGRGLSSEGRLGRQMRRAIGLRSGSIDQISILASGILRLALFTIAFFLVLAPWGVDGGDLTGYVKSAFFGFTVAGVTISISTIVSAVAVFGIGLFLTRSIQRWLEMRYLPHTGLDIGLRNSIRTIFGYIGVTVATALAISQAGLSLDKITIVAGALSVGIGFGLQSIVNNFVSGLILLWERPLRVGDWIVLGDEQGFVRRISVRATEVETFDKASLIVPNSEFISGRVKNWMHKDRVGRIIIPVGVAYGTDAELVRKVLLEAALGHREVLSEPKPRVFFIKFGDSSLDFELRCFVDVDSMLSVRSDLMFDILRRINAAGIEIPFPRRTLEVQGMEDLNAALSRSLGAMRGLEDKRGSGGAKAAAAE